MTCDFYRSDYSIATPNETFLGYEWLLAAPLSDTETRHPGRNVSLAHSSYIFPNMSLGDMLLGLSAAQRRNRDRIAKFDPIAKIIYNIKEDTLQSFVGMVKNICV